MYECTCGELTAPVAGAATNTIRVVVGFGRLFPTDFSTSLNCLSSIVIWFNPEWFIPENDSIISLNYLPNQTSWKFPYQMCVFRLADVMVIFEAASSRTQWKNQPKVTALHERRRWTPSERHQSAGLSWLPLLVLGFPNVTFRFQNVCRQLRVEQLQFRWHKDASQTKRSKQTDRERER